MRTLKCRILVAPLGEYGRTHPEMWEYEAPETCYDLVGCGIVFLSYWSPEESWSRIEILNEETGEWLPAPLLDSEEGPRYTTKRASWNDAKRMAPDLFDEEVLPAS